MSGKQKEQKVVVPAMPEWTEADFDSTEPFDWLYQFRENKFTLTRMLEKVKRYAMKIGIKNFLALWKVYLEAINEQRKAVVGSNVTQFSGQKMELVCGDYYCGDDGIKTFDKFGFAVTVCTHPLMPVRRLKNIDNGAIKIELAFKRSSEWESLVVDKTTISSAQKIIELSGNDIEVNSENARDVVKYLSYIESTNYRDLPKANSIGRLGWVKDNGFSPYVSNLTFDGDKSFKRTFEAVRQVGDYDKWLECVRRVRKKSVVARMMIDASFASVLVDLCNVLPFFFHVWGGTETGKTVCLMIAVSVWADPSKGIYWQTFNSTNVGYEQTAGFLNNLPLCLDELQSIKNKKDGFDEIVYWLAEGIGKTRGAKGGGVKDRPTWTNCMITTGEQPITTANSGAGAVNRIIEVDCCNIKVAENGVDVVSLIRKNYGWAGRRFIEALDDEIIEEAKSLYSKFTEELIAADSMDKQTAGAAMILTADVLAEKFVFNSGEQLKVEDIMPFMKKKDEVDQNKRAYDWLMDFIASNPARFKPNDRNEYIGECWGCIENEYIFIIKSVFDAKLTDAGFNSASFLSWAKRNEKIECDDKGRHTKPKRIAGRLARCVWVKQPSDENGFTELGEETPLPF